MLAIPPPGDIRRCLIALTPGESAWRDLFSFRFTEGDVKGHSLGNLILAALTEMTGDFEDALRTAEVYLGADGVVEGITAGTIAVDTSTINPETR